MRAMPGKTLYDKIWDAHVVAEQDGEAILYIDLHLIHEVTSPQAFTGLRQRGLKVRRPERTFATMDHPRGIWASGKDVYVLHPPTLTKYTDENGRLRTNLMYPDRTLDGMMIGMRTMQTLGSVLSSPVVVDAGRPARGGGHVVHGGVGG